MDFILNEYHRNITDEMLLDDIKRTSKELELDTITQEKYNKIGKYHACTLIRRFGSWSNVLSLAGLKPSRSKLNITDEELLLNIHNVWIKLGRQPKSREMKNPLSEYSAGTYEHRFGSWRKALEAFIHYIDNDFENASIEETCTNLSINQGQAEINKHKTKRDISLRLRFKILMRDGFTCKKCGRSPLKDPSVTLHVDHIKPWSKGGETTPDNLETKCEKCNLGKGNAFDV